MIDEWNEWENVLNYWWMYMEWDFRRIAKEKNINELNQLSSLARIIWQYTNNKS